jgi:hypothetical protein
VWTGFIWLRFGCSGGGGDDGEGTSAVVFVLLSTELDKYPGKQRVLYDAGYTECPDEIKTLYLGK